MLIIIRHTYVALIHKKTVLSLETSSEINFEFIKSVKKCKISPFFFFFFVFVALHPKSTAMVIAGRSVHLTALFPGQA